MLCLTFAGGSAYAKVGDVHTLLEDSSLRKGPDSFYASIVAVAKGDRVVELSSSGTWKKVRLLANGDVGWLAAHAFANGNQVSAKLSVDKIAVDKVAVDKRTIVQQQPVHQKLAIVQAPPDQPEHSMAPAKHVVSPLFEDGAISPAPMHKMQQQTKAVVPSASIVPPVVPILKAPHATLAVDHKWYRFSNKANLRAGPNVKYDTVSWARTGSQANVLDRKGDWLRVQMQVSKRIGWVYKDSLIAVGAVKKTEPADHNMKLIVSDKANFPQPFTFHVTTALKSGPGTKFDAVVWAKEGAKASQLARKGDWLRVRMQLSKRIGWVHIDSLDAVVAVPVAAISSVKKLTQTQINKPTKNVEQAVQSKATKLKGKADIKIKEVDTKALDIKTAEVPVASRKALPKIKPPMRNNNVGNDSGQILMQTTMIRKQPSALSEVLGWAGSGAQVEKLSRQGKWTKVRMQNSGRVGWVESTSFQSPAGVAVSAVKPYAQAKQKNIVTADVKNTVPVKSVMNKSVMDKSVMDKSAATTKQQAALPIMQGIAKTKAVTKSGKSVYKFNKKSNMRAGPKVTFDTVSWAGSGAKALELDRIGDWIRIQMLVSKRIGWVYKQSLDLVSKGAEVAVDVAGASASAVGAIAVSALKPTTGVDAVKPSGQQSVAQQSVVQEPVAQGQVTARIKNGQNLSSNLYSFNKKSNLRAGPGKKYDTVSWAGNGAYAKELGRKSDWIHVQMQVSKRIGWVFHRSLKLVKAGVKSVAVNTERVSEKTSVTLAKQLYFFKRTSNLRAGPGKKYERIAWGGRNESAEEVAHQGDWKRVRMTISGKVGWVFKSYLVPAIHASYGVLSPAQYNAAHITPTGRMYQVVRTEPLRADAGDFSELIGSVQKGEIVAWLEERNGWVRVNPQDEGGKVGWIERKLLKQNVIPQFEYKQALMNKKNVADYRSRVSKGEAFNFSYAALEAALYKVPVEDIHIRIGKDDLKALFLKRQYDQSPFDIRLKTGRHNLHGTVKVLGSSTRVFKKKSLLIKLDKQSGRWYGHRRLALRSMASDKGLMREWIAWKMMAAMGMKVPEVHFTRVSFNRGEKTGLYLSIEWMGPEFLEGNGLDKRGEFYQPDDASHCGDLYATDQDMGLCFTKITPQNNDYSHLKAMAIAVNAATDDNIDKVLAKYFDVESVINWIAVNALVTNGDTYNKNYWLYYHPSEDKWTVIPWDYNLTFGRTYDQYAVKAFRIFNDNFQYYYPPDVGAGNPIKDKLLRNPRLRARLETTIKHLTGMEANGPEHTFGWFSPTVMDARIGNLAAIVGKEVYKDTFLSYGEGDFTKTYESLMHYVRSHDYFLKTKLFGDFAWKPEPPNQAFVPMRLPDQLIASGQIKAGGESLHMVDRGWGYFVADVNLDKPLKKKVQFDVHIEGGLTPKYLPTGQSPRRCIERSWLLSTKTKHVSVTADLMFEYTQENSRRSEVPPAVHEELLELWMLDGNQWKPIQTEVNEYSNTLIAKNVHVKSQHEYRFVACSPF